MSHIIEATQQPYLDMVRDCELRSKHLTEWEIEIVRNIKDDVLKGVILSYGRVGKLEEIWEKATGISPGVPVRVGYR